MMEGSNYSLSDIAAVSDGGLGGNSSWLIILFVLIFGMGGWNRQGDYGQFATAASQQDILFSSKFQALDNKIDRIGNGIADATYALNNAVTNEGRSLQNMMSGYQMASQKNIDDLRFDLSRATCDIKSNDNANTQKILDVLSQNKIESLQAKVAELQGQINMCGVVRYPMQTTYTSGGNPFCSCNCGGI